MRNNFLGLSDSEADFDQAKVVILPIPYDATVSYQSGTRNGPEAIITSSQYVELYDDELEADISTIGIHTSDVIGTAKGGPKEMLETIEGWAKEIIYRGKFLVSLGGEHSISSPLVKAHARKYKNLSVLQLDAHADLRDSYQGTKYSHASAMRRIREITPAVQLGIRSFSEEDANFIKKENLPVLKSIDIIQGDSWKGMTREHLTENVYVTIDLDVLDPSIMPATGTPEPGGLGWYKVLEILKFVSDEKNIVGFDAVELMPIPGLVAPDFLAAKLIYRMIGYSLWKK